MLGGQRGQGTRRLHDGGCVLQIVPVHAVDVSCERVCPDVHFCTPELSRFGMLKVCFLNGSCFYCPSSLHCARPATLHTLMLKLKGLRIYPYPSGIGLGTRGTSGTCWHNIIKPSRHTRLCRKCFETVHAAGLSCSWTVKL